MNKLISSFIALIMLVGLQASALAQVVIGEHVDSQLISETTTVYPGQELWVALRLDHQENWHSYWKNPGDAGQPTEIIWDLPIGVTAGEIIWPTPERIELPPDLVDFGYENEIFLLTALSIPENFQAASLALSAKVSWLECDDICIPANANLVLTVPIGFTDTAEIDEQWRAAFALTRASFPREDIRLDSMFSINNGEINLLIQATESIFENAEKIRFIPGEHRIFDYNAEQKITSQLSSLQLSQSHHARVLRGAPENLGGLLVVTDVQGQEIAYQIQARAEGVSLAALGGVMPANSAGNDINIFVVFVFAMLGGIILNLMPCVFPVLSLKVMSLVSSRDSAIKEQRLHGVAYTVGVIGAFVLLASVLLVLQAGGAVIGWGFQLQSPWFVATAVYLFFVMGLSMSGVVEFGTSIMGAGSELAEKEGYAGSFFTGVLAGVVASPCTAPYMAAALGFALTQTMPVALAIFVALGFGMALPFLLLSFVPALAKLMPRPGKWMLTFKKILALPLYATVIWLLWVLSFQTEALAIFLVLGSCVLLALACWLYQHRRSHVGIRQHVNSLVIILCLVFSFVVLKSPALETQAQAFNEELALEGGYEVYSDARLAELRNSGTPVFVNMTAAWCITCLVNEKVALSSDVIKQALIENNVTYLKGDWTNNDPEITEVLKRFQTSGVPLYLMYPADPSLPAEMLPQILTEGIILEALTKLN